ncbi:GNAT family N-acetyltransferase [Enterococcus alishanensis]|uniref:Acetyltransferase n=1 Tax=Enterococcus alishanensis TaxID=1303817 RepID=A0ABS6TBU4_9ENTE|nr:GNAT family N-acetyltransferase [Enterococcus alishanensis]MBV7390356.1 acetyltransferase [Enterococcus alishanensis]
MISFKLVENEDLVMIEEWLNYEHVKKWYEIPELNVSIDDWLMELRQREEQFNWLTHLIVFWDNQPFGFCLYYKASDSHGEDFADICLDGTYGIDYLIGDPAFLGKGYGKKMILCLIEKILRLKNAKRITAEIDPSNIASRNVLLSCGFHLIGESNNRYLLEKEL